MKYLISRVETYRVENEEQAKQLIEDAKSSNRYTLSKYSNEHKEKKSKGEVIDEWQRVILTKVYNDEKDPLYPDEYNEDDTEEDY